MKTTLVLLILVNIFALGISDNLSLEDIQEQCLEESSITKSDLEGLDDMDSEKFEKFKQYVICTYQKSGIVDEAGIFNESQLNEEFDDQIDDVETITKQCITINANEEDISEKIYKVHMCLVGNIKTVFK